MDTRTGEIFSMEDLKKKFIETPEEEAFFIPISPTPEQFKRGKVSRNDYCPCGSGKKFKKCCLRKDEEHKRG